MAPPICGEGAGDPCERHRPGIGDRDRPRQHDFTTRARVPVSARPARCAVESTSMERQHVDRKLVAILSADVEGYSRLMGDDEAATVRTITAYRDVIAVNVTSHGGRVVDSPGDNVLAEFPSVVEAVQAAVEIQRQLASRNADLPPSRQMRFRIGINLG